MVLRRAFIAATIVWALALPLATRAVGLTSHLALGFALAVYGAGAVLCHQVPERSFFIWAAKMPVCARCTGIYLGAAGLAALAPVVTRARPALSSARTVLVLSAVPTAVTLMAEWSTGVMPPGWVRALAGAPMGAAVAWAVLTATLPEVN